MLDHHRPDQRRILHALLHAKGHPAYIAWACDVGSRAAGYATPHSDHDIRFITIRPPWWYLRIDTPPDTIEVRDGDLDIVGWDIRKVLQLLHNGNPQVLEWLHSPLVYFCGHEVQATLAALRRACYRPRVALHHYRNMARTTAFNHLTDRALVEPKKVIHTVRCILAARWVVQDQTAGVRTPLMPPLSIDALLACLPDVNALEGIQALVARRRAGATMAEEPYEPVLRDFIEENLHMLMAYPADQVDEGEYPTLQGMNDHFATLVAATWER